ncbi:MAG TPA: hypothetical protein VI911_11695 [Patescibacteria group bacterium]|nr:hypothetical protein [Patescibacteria group bacterium]
MSKKNQYDKKFQELAIQVNQAIIDNDGLIGDQKEQVELMISLERKFQYYAQKYAKTNQIYAKFIDYILHESGNILSAKPYFRERFTSFSDRIISDFKEKKGNNLGRYKINYLLIKFIVDNWGGPLPEKVQHYYNEYLEARRILIENNLPLAINRAKLFYRKTPRSHLNLLDLIDICVCGLITGIDKYCGDYTRVWRSTCIGNMVSNMIEEYSKTFLRLYPTDKKVLYRANALKYRLQIDSIEDLTKAVNSSFEKDATEGKKIPTLPISESHIRTLLNGVGYVSTDSKISEDNYDGGSEEGVGIYDNTPDPEQDVEDIVTKKDSIDKIINASHDLNMVEKKIIMLKGVVL